MPWRKRHRNSSVCAKRVSCCRPVATNSLNDVLKLPHCLAYVLFIRHGNHNTKMIRNTCITTGIRITNWGVPNDV